MLYEEALNELVLEDAIRAIRKADTLIVGGTSLAVYLPKSPSSKGMNIGWLSRIMHLKIQNLLESLIAENHRWITG